MLPANNLQFLKEKIEELHSALFFNTSNAVLKLPNSIVSALKVDDAGQIWFFVNRPEQYLHEFDKEFPAKLDFFRKGKWFYLHVTGKAFIVSDPEELYEVVNVTDDIRRTAMNHLVLIKFKIMNAEYFDQRIESNGAFQKMKTTIMKFLFGEKTSYRPYRLEPSY